LPFFGVNRYTYVVSTRQVITVRTRIKSSMNELAFGLYIFTGLNERIIPGEDIITTPGAFLYYSF